MKRNYSMWIGLFLLLLGLSIILKAIFKIDLPLFRIALGVFLIYLGCRVAFGACGLGSCSWNSTWSSSSSAFFTSKDISVEKVDADTDDYNIVFGKSRIDLTKLRTAKEEPEVEINVVFGEAVVFVDPKQSVRIRTNTVFGEAKTPDGNSPGFGTHHFHSTGEDKNLRTLHIQANVVFGALRFQKKE